PLGVESGAAEADADHAATGVMARLWGGAKSALAGALKSVGKLGTSLRSGMQLQRCEGDRAPVIEGPDASAAPPVPKGGLEGAMVGSSGPPHGAEQRILVAGAVLGEHKSFAAAVGVIRASGGGGAIAVRDGMFVAYRVTGFRDDDTMGKGVTAAGGV